jgi:hypothetical protein
MQPITMSFKSSPKASSRDFSLGVSLATTSRRMPSVLQQKLLPRHNVATFLHPPEADPTRELKGNNVVKHGSFTLWRDQLELRAGGKPPLPFSISCAPIHIAGGREGSAPSPWRQKARIQLLQPLSLIRMPPSSSPPIAPLIGAAILIHQFTPSVRA